MRKRKAKKLEAAIVEAKLAEVRRRIAEVEFGEAKLIPGDEVVARVRNLFSAFAKEGMISRFPGWPKGTGFT